MEKYLVFIDGSSGTTGLKIHELLKNRKEISLINIHREKRRQTEERLKCMKEADLTILCLPDEEAERICNLLPADCRVIDTSTAHRTSNGWTYGLPELNGEQKNRIAKADRVANPGCHATGFLLLAAPLRAADMIDRDCPLSVFSLTGYSGGGKSMIQAYEATDRPLEMKSPGIYGLGQNHKHLAEMCKYADLSVPPAFLPVVCDYYSGMLVTIPLHRQLMKKPMGPDGLRRLYQTYYSDAKAVSAASEASFKMVYSNAFACRPDLEILVYGNEERPVVSARFDNLGKGAAAAAVQNMDLMLGISE